MGSKQTETLNNNISYAVTLPNSTSVLPEKYYFLPPAANYISGWIKAQNFNLIVRQISLLILLCISSAKDADGVMFSSSRVES